MCAIFDLFTTIPIFYCSNNVNICTDSSDEAGILLYLTSSLVAVADVPTLSTTRHARSPEFLLGVL